MCLQETWLLDNKMYILEGIDSGYVSKGKTGIDVEKAILVGRPSGGVSIMYKKVYEQCITIIPCKNKRLYAIKLDHSCDSTLVINVYMPCDNRDAHNVNDDFIRALEEIECLMNTDPSTHVILCGDWNCDFKRRTSQVRYLQDFMERLSLVNGWSHASAMPDFTYVNDSLGHMSQIDHFIMSRNVYDSIDNVVVCPNGINMSKHVPLIITLRDSLDQLRCQTVQRAPPVLKNVAWHRISENDVLNYKICLDRNLTDIQIPHEALVCKDVMCKSESHRHMINTLCQEMVNSCIKASNDVLPHVKSKTHALPFWNELVEPYKEKSLFWHWVWIDCGKPHDGVVAQIMRATRARYHKAVKDVKRQEDDLRRQRLAEAISNNSQRHLWRETKRMTPRSNIMSSVIDGEVNSDDIAEVFAKKYEALYQSVPTDQNEINKIMDELQSRILCESSISECRLNVCDIDGAIKKLNKGKGDGSNGFYSDHLILSSDRFKTMVAMLVNCMLIHGYNADELLASVIASIPKCSRSSLNTSENYRGISLCCSMCKVIDYVFIDKYSSYLKSSHLQFAFKAQHDTVLCSATVKETVQYFLNKKSNVYACMLDASKAFDKVHFGKLFKLLIDRKIPAVVIRLLLDSYTRQKICTVWNGAKSRNFSAVNGVRQGGVLSPILFTIYFDEMIHKLEKSGIGCKIGVHYVGAFAYADDVILLSPSRSGLQCMINICELFGVEFMVTFNSTKTQCMLFTLYEVTECGPIFLQKNELKWSTQLDHLGNILTKRLDDVKDMVKKKGSFVGSFNKFMSNFSHVQSTILKRLFQSYCSSFYGCTLWKLSVLYDDKICTEWNKAVRRVWRLPPTAHTRLLGPINGQLHISAQIAIRFVRFYHRALNCDNPVVRFIAMSAMNNKQSYLRSNILFIKWKYGFNICDYDKNECINRITVGCVPDDETTALVKALLELISSRDGFCQIPNLDKHEITHAIIFLSTCDFI